jgi:sulfate transport system substrate-binding protein
MASRSQGRTRGDRARRARFFFLAAMALPGLLGMVCAPRFGHDGDTLAIGAYSVVREAFHEGLLPAFSAQWKARTGRTVRFEESYNASGAQARAISAGFDADIAILSLEGDMDLLVKAGLVEPSWKAAPNGGMVTNSLVVIGVREGNPRGIYDWSDLTKPGVGVLYPDPKTSGGARWNVNAIYGAALLTTHSKDAAREQLASVQANVVNMDASGRQSMATFDRGVGDAVVTYENELLLRRRMRGAAAPYVVPPATLLIESPAALVEASVRRHGNRAVAEAFLQFMRSAAGQSIFTDYGFRPLDRKLDTGRTDRPALPDHVFSMRDLGGWGKVKKEVYDAGGIWDSIFLKTNAKTNARAGARGS